MRIDYSIPLNSKFLGYLDTNFRFSLRHVALGLSSQLKLSLLERTKHLALGTIEFIPIVGHLVAFADKKWNGKVRILKLDSTNPYEMGYAQGIKFRSEIKTLYQFVQQRNQKNQADYKKDTLDEAKKLEKFIPQEIIDEMKGLAAGAQVSYEDVLCVNTFLDIYPGMYGCTAAGLVQENGAISKKAIAANHSVKENKANEDSLKRYKTLEGHAYTTRCSSYQSALQSAANDATVHSIIFNINKRSIKLGSAWSNASITQLNKVKGQKLWNANQASKSNRKVTLLRNLDWPWAVLGSETILVVRSAKPGHQETAIVTWPGYFGALSGMNASGVALAACSRNNITAQGMPTTLLFRKALEQSTTANQAINVIKEGKPASSMNVVVAGDDDVSSVELHQNSQNQKECKQELRSIFDSAREFSLGSKHILRVVDNRKKRANPGKVIEL